MSAAFFFFFFFLAFGVEVDAGAGVAVLIMTSSMPSGRMGKSVNSVEISVTNC